ncbi:MAG: non-heme iron oxygenase ferredoxin subunit [Sinobacteraceae bacterium]|nr:non-heme iron oxygenase ferredoxin subunit [Nevskiaceae bacterium]
MTDWVDVAAIEELESGQARLVKVEDVMVAVFNIDGEYRAIEDTCSHDGAPMLGCGLETGDVLDGDQVICPRHGARFCLRTGEALTPPAYEPLTTFMVRVADGRVQVRDDRWD